MAACFHGEADENGSSVSRVNGPRTVACFFGIFHGCAQRWLILKDRVYITVEDPSYGYWRSGGDALC